MQCAYPLTVKHGDLSSLVRCGQCRMCRTRRKQAWVGRLLLENRDHAEARFLTLTYAEEPGTLEYSDLQKFIKRYRFHYGPCRFFAVGEYGSKTFRGHWHVLIFGHPPVVRGHWLENKAWTLGYTYDGNVTRASCGYVGGYVMKYHDRDHQPIVRQSLRPGIGFSRLGALAESAARTCPLQAWPAFIRVEGRPYPLSQGALLHFKKSYIEAGGVSPLLDTPEDRDAAVYAFNCDGGTRLQKKRALALSYRELADRHAALRG